MSRYLWNMVVQAYVSILGRPSLQWLNDCVLRLSLHARGYNNYAGTVDSGERWFIETLATRNPQVCIDIGANTGAYSRAILATTAATVFAMEPLPQAYEELERLRSDYPDRFEPVRVGVSHNSGVLELHYGAARSEFASFAPEVKAIPYVGAQSVNAIHVPVVSLDDYWAERNKTGEFRSIDLIKIDVEGFEYEVLLGAKRTIDTMRPCYVQIEFNWHQLMRGRSLRELGRLLPGYQAHQLLPGGAGWIRRELDLPESNIYCFSNWVFVRSDLECKGL